MCPHNCLPHRTECGHKTTTGENGPPQRGPWWFSGCLCLHLVLDLSFPCGGLGNYGIACRVLWEEDTVYVKPGLFLSAV